MVKRDVLIKNPTGLHARPATQLVNLVQPFRSSIEIINGSISVDPKSIFSVLAGELRCGTRVDIVVTGDDEEKALEEICNFIELLEE